MIITAIVKHSNIQTIGNKQIDIMILGDQNISKSVRELLNYSMAEVDLINMDKVSTYYYGCAEKIEEKYNQLKSDVKAIKKNKSTLSTLSSKKQVNEYIDENLGKMNDLMTDYAKIGSLSNDLMTTKEIEKPMGEISKRLEKFLIDKKDFGKMTSFYDVAKILSRLNFECGDKFENPITHSVQSVYEYRGSESDLLEKISSIKLDKLLSRQEIYNSFVQNDEMVEKYKKDEYIDSTKKDFSEQIDVERMRLAGYQNRIKTSYDDELDMEFESFDLT